MTHCVNHDLHVHTKWSDGSRTIAEQVYFARSFGLDAIAITDHVGPGFQLADPSSLRAYLGEIRRIRSGVRDLHVLAGAEATALDCRGSFSLREEEAHGIEWVLCDLSSHSVGTLKDPPADAGTLASNVIRTYLAICDSPWIDVIAHPFNTGNIIPTLLPADYPERLLEELADAMAQTDTVFDVMNLTPYWFLRSGIEPGELKAQYATLVALFAQRGVRFQISSDDHRCGLGHTTWSRHILHTAGVPSTQIVDACAVRKNRS